MNFTEKYGNSSFWMGNFDTESENLSENQKSNNNYYKLAAQKRAISNFVSIVTNQRIPVQFANTGDSYTDGQSVVISSKLDKESEFDVAVGLALHEGSHIKLSDFKLLESLPSIIYKRISSFSELYDICNSAGISMTSTIKDILNWVEDRRIDNYIYESSPGYRGYYQSLYSKYFNDELIDRALKSNEYTSETLDSYMFRLINLHSKYSRLNALKGLKQIYQIVDLKNIDRLKNTEQALDVALDIFKVIFENINEELKNQEEAEQNQNQSDKNRNDSDSDSSDKNDGESNNQNQSDENGNDSDSDFTKNSKGSSSKNEMDDETFEELLNSMDLADGDSAGTDEDTQNSKKVMIDNLPDNAGDLVSEGGNFNEPADETISLTDRQKQILSKKIEKQKEFIRGEISKSKLSKKDAKAVDIIERSGAEFVEVGSDYNNANKSVPTINCILVKNMTRELMESDGFPLSIRGYDSQTKQYGLVDRYKTAVEDGIRLGTILGKKMQVRSESRDTVYNRQLNGKLDKRMVASLGYGNTQAFYTKETDMYNKVNLHISVDASSSMIGGNIWNNTITNVVALAKAVDMIPNLELQISFRTTDSGSNGNPYIVMAYDSRKDKFIKIKQLFPSLRPYGTTPEGLCFEAIQKYMIASSNGLDSYFLNISDGEPYYNNSGFIYAGYEAANHIKKMMDNFRKMGIGVLSYFVAQRKISNNSAQYKIFSESYGKSARFIDVTSVNDVSKTMNKLFLEKN